MWVDLYSCYLKITQTLKYAGAFITWAYSQLKAMKLVWIRKMYFTCTCKRNSH